MCADHVVNECKFNEGVSLAKGHLEVRTILCEQTWQTTMLEFEETNPFINCLINGLILQSPVINKLY